MGDSVEQQYRRFLLVVSASIFAGSIIELVFVEHYEGAIQLVPFVLAAIGLIVVLAAMRSPGRRMLTGLRYLMWMIAAGGLFGVYEHLEHNYEFAVEIAPNISTGEALIEMLYGASPFMAPGILCLGAILAYSATWRHPGLAAD
ncbi:MAG: hypothetical protein R3281_06635 [Balneolaceae bacterium]|nr:hypothetical protein [Balneolaceae bacterium]